MDAIIEGLLDYIDKTSDKQFDRDFAKLEEYNKIGPDINSFIQHSYQNKKVSEDRFISESTLKNRAMKVITIKQPWAYLLCAGIKGIDEKYQVISYGSGDYICKYCGGKWYK